ncbi:hypothetical protein KP509_18G052500 [Ceratopteris richardii]|uniref:Galectin domain-containing protein n=1 Tax=Ceratopteris richardii TaxID=49495 RepID=A0A8T2SRT2_CERRI|nr:hypothetical protein KP509_18G052500 [Ceratopteris richardii]
MTQIGRAYGVFKSHFKWKPRLYSAQALIAFALLLFIYVSLVSPQLFRVPRSNADEEDLNDFDFKTVTSLSRPQSRELKAEPEAIVKRRNSVGVPEQSSKSEVRYSTERLIDHATEEEQKGKESSLIPSNHKAVKVKGLRKTANMAWKAGRRAWKELEDSSNHTNFAPPVGVKKEMECPKSIIMEGEILKETGGYMKFPCGLTIGSAIAVVGMPRGPHLESKPTIGHIGNPASTLTEVSQFMFELHGPRPSNGEDPPRILHINPRLKGDWSEKPVIELNSFSKGLWGRSQRCDGTRTQYQERVEGLLNCERWLQDDGGGDEPSWWLRRLIDRKDKPEMSWRYPFVQNRSFVMTVRAGLEGYHMSVDGKHISSFGYQAGLSELMTAAVYVGGDVDLQALIATSLPSAPPKPVSEQIFENWQQWRAPKLHDQPISLFIGVLSSSNHFAERMAIRSTWFQDRKLQTGEVVARFFVALHPDRELNMQMKKEAEYYGDMVIVPFMDEYDLVVLKTLAICEFGIHNVTANYIMKCDDDTFVRVEEVLNELKKVNESADTLYMGNMNMFHRPLRMGKWAVTFEEWPDEEYPTYANGPGYIISRSIASFIVAQNRKRAIELFKMEDVSMGLWVKQYQETHGAVKYVNVWKFFQGGCEDGYIIAHYQSPRHMLCLYKKLSTGDAHCCY